MPGVAAGRGGRSPALRPCPTAGLGPHPGGPPVAGWATVSSPAIAGGTLVLAVASLAPVRSADRAALSAERAVLRPLPVSSRLEAPEQKLIGTTGTARAREAVRGLSPAAGGDLYLAASIRNIGPGLGVTHGRLPVEHPADPTGGHPPSESFRPQTRDLYLAPGDPGFWHAANPRPGRPGPRGAPPVARQPRARPHRPPLRDHEVGRRTISRLALIPRHEGAWICQVVRHWNLDRPRRPRTAAGPHLPPTSRTPTPARSRRVPPRCPAPWGR